MYKLIRHRYNITSGLHQLYKHTNTRVKFCKRTLSRNVFDVFSCFLVWVIDQFSRFFSRFCYCVTRVTPFIRRSKGCTEKNSRRFGPCSLEGGLRPENHIESRIFLTRGKVLSSLHLRKCLQRNIPTHVAGNEHFLPSCPKYLFSQTLDFESRHRALARGQNSLDRT